MNDRLKWIGVAAAAIFCADAFGQSTLTWLDVAPTAVSADGGVVVGNVLANSNGNYFNRASRWTKQHGRQVLPALSAAREAGAYGVSGDGTTTVGWSYADDGYSRPVLWNVRGELFVIPWPDGYIPAYGIGGNAGYANRVSFDGSRVFGIVFFFNLCGGSTTRAWVWDAERGTQYLEPTPSIRVGNVVRSDDAGGKAVVTGTLWCGDWSGLSAYRNGTIDLADGSFVSFSPPLGFTTFSVSYTSRDLTAAVGWAMINGADDRVAYIHQPPVSFRRVCAASGGGGLLRPLLGPVGADGAWAAGFGSPDGSSNATEAVYWTPERGIFRLTEYLRNTGADVPPGVTLRSVVDASADGLVLVGDSDAGAWMARLQPVSTCRFDLNFDGVVDDADFTRFVLAYNNVFDAAADANQDCITDDSDFSPFAVAYDALLCP